MGEGAPQKPSQSLWWLPNVIAMLGGLGLIALGVLDHDNQALIVLGTGLVSGAAGHAVGVQQPVP